MTLWTVEALQKATNGTLTGKPQAVHGISIDSRTIAKGDLYIALKGDAHDGHAFVKASLDKDASLALVSREWANENHQDNLLIVEDVMEAMRAIGKAARARTKAKIIAVTGSVGKTSTKDMLSKCFAIYGKTHAAVASFNNHWGVPLTLARMPAETQFGIFEIGMNHLGEITPLVQMVRPHVAIITTVEPVHLAQFNGIEEIAQAKSEIFDGLLPDGTAILNCDNPWFSYLADKAKAFKIVSFGEGEGADVRLLSYTPPHLTTTLLNYDLGARGKHMAMNSLAVLAALRECGCDLEQSKPLFAALSPVKGRGEIVTLPHNITLNDESYNANPASMKAAFAVLRLSKGRKVAALGDMLELGAQEIAMHEELANHHEGIDIFFAQGTRMKAFYEALPPEKRGGYAPSAIALLPILQKNLRSGDTLMVKGSLGSRMVDLVAKLKEHS